MIRPSESALRDLMAIRKRVLAKTITTLAEAASVQIGEGAFSREGLWFLRSRIQRIARQMVRKDFDFRVNFDGPGGILSVEVQPHDGHSCQPWKGPTLDEKGSTQSVLTKGTTS